MRMMSWIVLALCFAGGLLQAQETRPVVPPPMPETEQQRLATAPPDFQTYRRYRYWVSFQPSSLIGSGLVNDEALRFYQEYLLSQGTGEIPAAEQIRVIRERGKQLEIEGWNFTLTAEKPIFDTNPNAFLMSMIKGRHPGKALDVGMGQGRNAIWLAGQGWDVTGFDPADKAVALANELAKKAGVTMRTVIATDDEFDFGENQWDLIVMSYVNIRGNAERAAQALRPGGIVVAEYFHRDFTTAPPGAFLDNELIETFRDLRVLHYEDAEGIGDWGMEKSRLVRICAQKR